MSDQGVGARRAFDAEVQRLVAQLVDGVVSAGMRPSAYPFTGENQAELLRRVAYDVVDQLHQRLRASWPEFEADWAASGLLGGIDFVRADEEGE